MVAGGAGKVEVALRAGGVQLDGQFVRMNGLLQLSSPVVGVTQVVESWVVEWVESDGVEVELDCLAVVVLVAIGVSEVVEALYLLWVQLKRFLVVLDGFIHRFEQIESIG